MQEKHDGNGGLKYPKPGKTKKKKQTYLKSSSRGLKRPDEMICQWCGIESPTCCFRHAEDDIIKFLDGGGIAGGRINDNLTVFGCYDCDQKYSKKPDRDASEIVKLRHSIAWAVGIIKTHLL